jgi:protein-S-isoprenylcysteine O-methyltransferase Ste14
LDAVYRALVIALFTSLMAIRVVYRIRSGARAERPQVQTEGLWLVAFRIALMLPLYALTFFYAFRPQLVSFLALDLPLWLRFLGLGPGIAGLGLLAWAHVALDGYFSPTLRLRENHVLIDHGPYSWIQHPMYTAYLSFFLGVFLLSGHPWIGGLGVAVILSLMTMRLPKEEAMLEKRFGEKYAQYRSRTGRFLPRLARNRASVDVAARTRD